MSSQLIVYIAARRPSGVCTWCVCKVSHPVHCAPQCTTPLVIPVTSLPSYGSVRSILHPEWDSDHLLGGSDWNHHSEATGMGRDHQHSSLFRIHHLLTGIIVVPLEGQPSMHLGLDCHPLPVILIASRATTPRGTTASCIMLCGRHCRYMAQRQLRRWLRAINFRRMPFRL